MRWIFVAGIAMMALAVILSLIATSERIERFDKEYEASGLLDLEDEKNFLADKTVMDCHIRLTGDTSFEVRITNGGKSTGISTNSLELPYIPDRIEVTKSARYECEIIASSGKPYLILSVPAIILSLAGFAILFTTGTAMLRRKGE